MENSRPSTPDNLWSSILDSVSSSRSLPTKQIILLGQPSTGKSTIASALLRRAEENKHSDFVLGYGFTDVRDDGDEGAYAHKNLTSSHSQPSLQISLPVSPFTPSHPQTHPTQHCCPTFCLSHNAAPYLGYDPPGLNTTLVMGRGIVHVAAVGKPMDQGRWFQRA